MSKWLASALVFVIFIAVIFSCMLFGSGGLQPAIGQINSDVITPSVVWLQPSYPANGQGVLQIVDPDMNLNPKAVDKFDTNVWSVSDYAGIKLTMTETGQDTGIFQGTVYFTTNFQSSGNRLHVEEGDTVTCEYRGMNATTFIGTIVSPLERAPASNPRIVDSFSNAITGPVKVGQQIQVIADLANGQDRDQPFVYVVQIQDSNGVTVSLSLITGTLTAGQSFHPAQSWTPSAAGTYTAQIFVWQSINNPNALSAPISMTIPVVIGQSPAPIEQPSHPLIQNLTTPISTPTVTVHTDKPSYTDSDVITISGSVSNFLPGAAMTIKITNPISNLVYIAQPILQFDKNFLVQVKPLGSLWNSYGAYQVYAQYGNNKSSSSTQFNFHPVSQPPIGLTATAASSSQINLSWTAPNDNGGSPITGYQIERSPDSGSTWLTIANTNTTATIYSDPGLESSTSYTYRVSAIHSVGTSSPSNPAAATTGNNDNISWFALIIIAIVIVSIVSFIIKKIKSRTKPPTLSPGRYEPPPVHAALEIEGGLD